ncbi:MAG: TIGR00266 family protein [Thermoplasmata archaeon]|nr:TIGR00266 family protein [Thermoplasmata archaeon]
MKYRILGNDMQTLIVELEPGERVYAEAGSMVHMSGNMKMEAKMVGGLGKAIGRFFARESAFMQVFEPVGGPGIVAFSGAFPGQIVPLEVRPGKEYILQKTAFLAATEGVELSVAFQQKLGAVFFGGEGLILEKVHGNGIAWIYTFGNVIKYDLKPGQELKVDAGSAVAWESTVDYDITRVKGLKTIIFGGEGLFLTSLRGPGTVYLQSMELPAFIHQIAKRLGR